MIDRAEEAIWTKGVAGDFFVGSEQAELQSALQNLRRLTTAGPRAELEVTLTSFDRVWIWDSISGWLISGAGDFLL